MHVFMILLVCSFNSFMVGTFRVFTVPELKYNLSYVCCCRAKCECPLSPFPAA